MGGQEEGGEALAPPHLSHSPQHPEEQWDGVFVSNGPGDPSMCPRAIESLRRFILPALGNATPADAAASAAAAAAVAAATAAASAEESAAAPRPESAAPRPLPLPLPSLPPLSSRAGLAASALPPSSASVLATSCWRWRRAARRTR